MKFYKLESESYDCVIAIGMLEHILTAEHKYLFDHIYRVLKPEGRCLLHQLCTTLNPNQKDLFIQQYIFPNSNQKLVSELVHEIEIRGMALHDIENIVNGYNYTLACWRSNIIQFYETEESKSLTVELISFN